MVYPLVPYRAPTAPYRAPYGSGLPGRIGPMSLFMNGGGGVLFPASVVPTFWLDGRLASFSDAAKTQIAFPPLGRVNKAPQPVPLTGDFTSSNTTDARPFRDQTSFCFETTPTTDAQAGLNFNGPAGVTLPANAVTLAFNLVNRISPLVNSSSNKGVLFGTSTGTGQSFGPIFVNNILYFIHNGAYWNTGVVCPLGTPFAAVARYSATGIDLQVNIGGVISTPAPFVGAIPADTIATLKVGLVTDFNDGLNASVSQVIGVPRIISDLERTQLLAWVASQVPAEAFPSKVNFIAIGGDSIGEGFGVSSYQCWAYRMLPTLEAIGPQLKMLNLGIPGNNIPQAQAAFASTIAPLFSTNRLKNVLVAQIGTNSLAFGGLTAAQALTLYYQYCDTAKALGYYVIACTVLPRSDAGIDAGFEAKRTTYNADIVANYAAHANALCNFASVAGMGAAGDSNGANYQADHVHPSVAGYVLLTPIIQAACVAALS